MCTITRLGLHSTVAAFGDVREQIRNTLKERYPKRVTKPLDLVCAIRLKGAEDTSAHLGQRHDTSIITWMFDQDEGSEVLIVAMKTYRKSWLKSNGELKLLSLDKYTHGVLEWHISAKAPTTYQTQHLVLRHLLNQIKEKGRWLDRPYRSVFGRLWVQLEWAFLSWDILTAEPHIFIRLVQLCLFIGLYVLGSTTSSEALRFISRRPEEWRKILLFPQQQEALDFTLHGNEFNKSRHEVAVFRRVFERAGGQCNAYQRAINEKYSDEFASFGGIIGLASPKPAEFDSISEMDMNEALAQAPVFEGVQPDSDNLLSQLKLDKFCL